MAAAEVSAVAFEQSDLSLGQHEGLLLRLALESEQPLGASLQVVAEAHAPGHRGAGPGAGEPPRGGRPPAGGAPRAPGSGGAAADAGEPQLVGDAFGPSCWAVEGVLQNLL